MSNTTKKWFALYTKPGCEKKVANLLSRKNIENYCPLKRHVNSKNKVLLEPLFSSYVFVQINDADMVSIRKTDCVLNFVYWLGRPAIIRGEEIEIIKRFMIEYSIVRMEKIPFDADGMARVIDGTPSEMRGSMVSVKNSSVKIVLPSLGYVMLAEVEKSVVEIISTHKQAYAVAGKYKFAI